jgi:MFS family permease
MNDPSLPLAPPDGIARPWWRGLTRRHWGVLGIAWLGWVFDTMDVFLLVLVKEPAMRDLLGPDATRESVSLYGGYALGITLVGWSLGGLLFGMVADRFGRTRTMALTILVYSVFTGLTGFAQTWWQLFLFRFIASLGIGGEWGTGAAMVAEVFPSRSRTAAAGILQSAAWVGFFLATLICGGVERWTEGSGAWRYAFFAGAVPAFLALGVRLGVREPEAWIAARRRATESARERLGSVLALFQEPELRRRTLLSTALGLVGIFAYWGTTFWAPESLSDLLRSSGVSEEIFKARRFHGTLVLNAGILAGFLLFIPVTSWLGRRKAFYLFYGASAVAAPLAFLFATSYAAWLALFFFVGAFSSGMFSGYTIYFPELFPTRVRATGAGFAYNVGRIAAAPAPILRGWFLDIFGSGAIAGAVLGSVYILAFLIIPLLPETSGIRLDADTGGPDNVPP